MLPDHGFDIAGLLVGSESTLVTVLHAELELVPVVPERVLVMLGFDSVMIAADAVPTILPYDPIALEGFDHHLINDQRIKHLNPDALRQLPDGKGFLMVQFGGKTREDADDSARRMLDALGDSEHNADVAFMDRPEYEDELWRAREAGLAATAHLSGEPEAWPGWEDAAVAPESLGRYLPELDALWEDFGYASDVAPSIYGHFDQGCVHTRTRSRSPAPTASPATGTSPSAPQISW